MNYLIKDLNKNEKPREKLILHGAASLTDAELIALLIRSGGKESSALDVANNLLKKYESLDGLIGLDTQHLNQFKYIDIAKSSAIISAIEIAMRIKYRVNKSSTKIQKPEHIFDILKNDLYKKSKEHLYLLSLNSRNQLISKDLISIGTINETLLSPREIFRQALLRNAVGIIIAHNHPSSDPTPSDEDILTTKNLAEASIHTGLIFLDHIIISDEKFISMKSLGLLNINIHKEIGGDNK